MVKSKLVYFILGLSVVATFGCEKQAFFNVGDVRVKTFEIDTFYTLEVNAIFEIKLQNSDKNRVIAEGGSNLLNNLDFYNQGNKLFLENNNKFDWSRKYDKIKLTLHTTSLNHINIRVPCELTTSSPFIGNKLSITDWEKFSEIDLEVDVKEFRFGVSSDNAGICRVSGNAESVWLRPWGSCFIYADELISNHATITHSSIGDCFVNATKKLNITIDESGTIYYAGDPEVNIIDKSAGQIVSLQDK